MVKHVVFVCYKTQISMVALVMELITMEITAMNHRERIQVKIIRTPLYQIIRTPLYQITQEGHLRERQVLAVA